MPLRTQLLRLCAVSALLTLLLAGLRGLPQPSSANVVAGASCHAPSAAAFAASSEVRFVSQGDAEALVGRPGVAFVDCRPRAQYEAGHVTAALHFDPQASAIGDLVSELATATTVVTYCDAERRCERSLATAEKLKQAGLSDVRVLEGGLPAWVEHGFPAESGQCEHCEAAR